MNSPRQRLIYLAQAPRMTRSILQKVIKEDQTCTKIFDYSTKDLISVYQLSSARAVDIYQHLQQYQENHPIFKELNRYKIWTLLDQDFPPLLRFIPDPPVVLYGLGRADYLHHSPSLAVVGTRQPTTSAKKHIYQLLKPLVDQNWLLVSGMAKGIDGYAHRLADYYGGKTIAILAGGLQHPYPRQHLDLYERLTKSQLVISEYPPQLKPERYHFPERNRLISGLSFAILVVEAQERSGSLITADQALEQGREVMAVPGSIGASQTKGCHHLIQNGAKLVQNTYDILQEWDIISKNWQYISGETQYFN